MDHPKDLRWNRRLEDMEELKSLQDELLDSASLLVKPGGVLIYNTCSIDPGENEERVASFLLIIPKHDQEFPCYFLRVLIPASLSKPEIANSNLSPLRFLDR
ncbi:hypothetical protein M9H77_13233 [Catharanthus roseus]|uniref:Uncharacterized protein n=1 Tax=Catharanthus roseus TaxID=4058 RepID=A0ACC0BJR3_CATRO|nr:hypothetical protein M9H77_13233 [Catharanthus roseus]